MKPSVNKLTIYQRTVLINQMLVVLIADCETWINDGDCSRDAVEKAGLEAVKYSPAEGRETDLEIVAAKAKLNAVALESCVKDMVAEARKGFPREHGA